MRSFALFFLLAASVRAQYAQFPDSDNVGSDLTSTDQPTVAACEAECRRIPECKSYTATIGRDTVRCYTKSTRVGGPGFTRRIHLSTGLKGSCSDYAAAASQLANSNCGTSNGFAVYAYYDQLNVGDYRSLRADSRLACQAECDGDVLCRGYTAVGPPQGEEGGVDCYLKSAAVATALAGNGFTTSSIGRCDEYTAVVPATAQCNNELVTSAAARARSRRRSLGFSAKNRSMCQVQTEVACSLLKRDGTLAAGHECVDLQTDLDNCGACHNSCTSTQGTRVLFSGCQAGSCVALACKMGYKLDSTSSTCIPK